MAKTPKYIQMIASLAGQDFSYAPDQVLIVGRHIDPQMAVALLGPEDSPRARALDDDEGDRLYRQQSLEELDQPEETHEVPPMRFWSLMQPAELIGELDTVSRGELGRITRAWTEDTDETGRGPAFAETEDGLVYRFEGQFETSPVTWHLWEPERASEATAPADADTTEGDEVPEERSDGDQEEQETGTPEAGVERATDAAAETRETATQSTRRKRVKPPADKT